MDEHDEHEHKDKKSHNHHRWSCCGGGRFWGWFFLIIGGYFLVQSYGWIDNDFPFWQILLVVFGIYLLVGKKKKC